MKELLEQEVREMNNIIFTAVESFKIVEFLATNEEDEDKAYVKNRNNFFTYTMITNWRTTIIELSKLLSGGRNEDYDLRKFLNKLSTHGEFAEAGISAVKIKAWKDQLTEEKAAIDNIVKLRNKLYAHTDRDAATVKNIVTVGKAKELIMVAQSVIKEIYMTVFQSGFSFDAFNSPVNNLSYIVDMLTQQRKEKLAPLKALALQHGISDEFKES
jgi:hypothetical protein